MTSLLIFPFCFPLFFHYFILVMELLTFSISGALEGEPCISVEIKVLLTSIVFIFIFSF